MEELDEFGIPIKKPVNSKVDEFGIPIKKKESSVSTSTTVPRNSVLDGGKTSLGTSTNKGFPKIDTNSVAPGLGGQPKPVEVKPIKTFNGLSKEDLKTLKTNETPLPKIDPDFKAYLDKNKANLQRKSDLENELKTVVVTPENQDEITAKTNELIQLQKKEQDNLTASKQREIERENYSKIGSLSNKFLTGTSQIGSDIAAIPELVYDIFSIPQNAVAQVFDIPSLKADAEMFKKHLGVKNVVKDYYKDQVSRLRDEAQKTDLKYQTGVYDSFVNGDYSAGFDQLTNSFAESLPTSASIMVGGAYTKAPQLIAASSMMFGAGKNEKLKDENPEMSNNTRVANALATGLIQGATESLGSGSIGAAAKGLVEREGAKKATTILKDGLAEFYKNALKKNPLFASMSGEGLEEAFQGVAENAVDVATGAKPSDYNIYGSMADDFIGGAFGGSIFGGGLKGLQQITNYQDKSKIKNNTKQVFNLQKELQNPELSNESREEINKNIDGLIKSNQVLVQKNVDHVESLSPKVREELVKSIDITESTQEKARQIKLDQSTSDETKQILLNNLQKEFKAANEQKTKILEGSVSEVDVLPLKEQDKLKREALKELTSELNPDGTKNITIDDKQITERANKIYSKQIKDEPKQEATTTETQPQAEVQKPTIESEKQALETNTETPNEAIQETNIGTNGDIRPTIDTVGEIRDTESKGDIAEEVSSTIEPRTSEEKVEVSDLDHAKSEIEKGVLNWNSDIGTERINLGIPWSDIRKGKLDIEAGKINTAPAKKLIEALRVSKEKGGYEYVQGAGGQISKQFVSLEDMQRRENPIELTDAELEEINANEENLAKEYEDYFESLDDESKNEIYENQRGIESVDEKPTESGEGKVDVSGEKKSTTSTEEKGVNQDFEPKSGKKSLLNRAYEGGNSTVITDAIEKHGLDYNVENRKEAKKRAVDFVNEVGQSNALQAIRDNKIKGAEKAFVYSTVIDNLISEIDSTTDLKEREILEAEHAKIVADITEEFSQEGTDAGRFISALQEVYNSSKLKYNLTRQIESHKAFNDGTISDEVLDKFTKADKRIKELEKLIKEAEAKSKKAEDELAIKNVQEDIERKSQLANKNKSGLTPREQARKKELKNKFFGRLNDVTGVVAMLADPEFREYLGLTFKQAKGDLDNFTKRILNELGNGAKKHIPNLYEEAGKSFEATKQTIKIDDDGKIRIPTQIFRDYVAAGENDIDVIAAKIKEDIKEEFPDVEIREIRDALTGYGKQINPNQDEISKEMSRLKSLGKLLSAKEDVLSGERPLKSGLKREKPTSEMRSLRREINRLIKDMGLEEVDLEKQWASALDKIKSQLTNQIEDLENQISKGEKRKVERTVTVLDEEAISLKSRRDSAKKILDELVGKPELTEEQLITRAEKSLQTSIDKLQQEISEGKIEYGEKPTPKQSKKLDELRNQRKELVDIKNKMREESGLVEAQRLKTAKKRIANQIEDLKQRIENQDYAKKEAKVLKEDIELTKLRAEKLMQQEIFDAQQYADQLKNRTQTEKWRDAVYEAWNIERILRATGELSTVLIQGGILTVSRKLTNPKALSKIMGSLFSSLGSAKKAEFNEALIKAHPDYALAMKSNLALTNPDYKSDVREEQFTGDYANFGWDFLLRVLPQKLRKEERLTLGDTFLNPIKKLTGLGKIGTEKISVEKQWKNINPFRVLERGSTVYMNILRMEEFERGAEMLRMEGKNEVDHLNDYKLLANAVNTMTGRANLPKMLSTSSRPLAVVFFSARNALAVVNQVNPAYYGYLHLASSDKFQIRNTSVANKLAVTNFMRFVTITGSMMLALKFAAGEDEDGEDIVEIETDPRSSDFMKIKIGNIRFDPWHGQTGVVTLVSRLLTEQVKSIKTGEVENLADKRFGDKNRLDLVSRFARNKLSPSMARAFNMMETHEEYDPQTGEMVRMTPYGEDYMKKGSFGEVKPMYWDAVIEIEKEDPEALAQFLTMLSFFGLNTSVY